MNRSLFELRVFSLAISPPHPRVPDAEAYTNSGVVNGEVCSGGSVDASGKLIQDNEINGWTQHCLNRGGILHTIIAATTAEARRSRISLNLVRAAKRNHGQA